MAAAQVLSITELLQNVLYMLTECDVRWDCTNCKSRSSWFKQHLRHDPTLFSCLIVNSFWFSVTKHILWKAPYSIDVLLNVRQERRQLYANSIRTLEVTLPHRLQHPKFLWEPFDMEGWPKQNLLRHTKRLQQLERLSFPRLHEIYIVILADPTLISLLRYLPTEARHVCVRFAYDTGDLDSHHTTVKRMRKNMSRNDSISFYEHHTEEHPDDPYRLTQSALQSVIAYVHDFRNLKGLHLIDFPKCQASAVWECVSRMSQLEILEAKAVETGDPPSVFPEPAHPQLSHLKSLRLEGVTFSKVFGILGDARNLENFQVRFQVRRRSMEGIKGVSADRLLRSLSANENLKHVDIAFSLYGYDHCTAPFTLEEQSLLIVSERCKRLEHFALYGYGRGHFSDETFFKFSQDLPNMEVFMLPIIAEQATHQSLISMSKHWPRLRRLDTYTFFDFGQVLDTDFFMPNLEELHMGLRTESQMHQAEPSSAAWKRVLNDLCPELKVIDIEYDHSHKDVKGFDRPFEEHYIQRFFAPDPYYLDFATELDPNGNPWPALPEDYLSNRFQYPTRNVESTASHLSGPAALPSGQEGSIATVLGYFRRVAQGLWGY